MAKFFLPLILILFIAWLIVGLNQEYNNSSKEEKTDTLSEVYSNSFIEAYYDSLTKTHTYNNFKLINYKGINFLIPDSLQENYELASKYQANKFFSNGSISYSAVLYSDLLSMNSNDISFSKENYAIATIEDIKTNGVLKIIDSTLIYTRNNVPAIKMEFLKSYINEDGQNDSLYLSFVSLANNKRVYMIIIYGDPVICQTNKSVTEKIYNSVILQSE